jgi:hypothetical protein
MRKSGRFWGLFLLLIPCFVYAQDFTGTYISKSGGVTYTLVLRQDAQGKISGTLSGTDGKRCQVSAALEEDIAVGLCEGDINAQFEAEIEGSTLLWAMFELGSDGNPDFTKETNLDFTRQSAKAPAGQAERQSSAPPAPKAPQPAAPAPPVAKTSPAAIKDPDMNIAFTPPQGWKASKQQAVYLLGSDQYKGFIVIMPHNYSNLDQMNAEAQEGIIDEGNGIQLMPTSGFKRYGQNGLSAEFSGVVQGREAKAYAIGLISPNGGGGVTIMAAVESGSYTAAYPQFVQTLASGLTFTKPQAGAAAQGDMSLMQYFAGKYYSYTSGSTIYGSAGTERQVMLCPNGLFYDSSEFSASGQGEVDWGGAQRSSGAARWSIRGNKSQGTITIIRPNGRSEEIPYQVESKGVIYFNGIKFAYAGAPECR